MKLLGANPSCKYLSGLAAGGAVYRKEECWASDMKAIARVFEIGMLKGGALRRNSCGTLPAVESPFLLLLEGFTAQHPSLFKLKRETTAKSAVHAQRTV